jgi:hypothetical protein
MLKFDIAAFFFGRAVGGKLNMSAAEAFGTHRANGPADLSPVETFGEIFGDNTMIELIRNARGGADLMLWDGKQQVSGECISHGGNSYAGARLDRSVLRQLILPKTCAPHSSTRDLLGDICALMIDLVDLDQKQAGLLARLVLDSAIVDVLPIAPALVITGSDMTRGSRLMTLLHCLCRHPLSLTGVTPARLCSLPSGGRFTLLITQSTVSKSLKQLLDDVSVLDSKIPVGGRLIDLFGLQVLRCDCLPLVRSGQQRTIEIRLNATGKMLRRFDSSMQQRIADEFQARLLGFRRANLFAAGRIQFDASRLDMTLRMLAASLAAATPDEQELQDEVVDLLRDDDNERRSERWTDPKSVACEAVLVAYDGKPGESIYVGELAQIAHSILLRRQAEDPEVSPGELGKVLRALGIKTQPRDAKGIKLLLSDDLAQHARSLCREFGGPQVDKKRYKADRSRTSSNSIDPRIVV